MPATTDILMITHRRPHYTRLSLNALLESCGESDRVWIWHNGSDQETLSVVNGFLDHPRVHRFNHSQGNVGLKEPTNWLWSNATGDHLAKVDDDCIVPKNWIRVLSEAHTGIPNLGIVGCWHFREEDVVPALIEKKIQTLANGHRIVVNSWIGGSGYLMKRGCLDTAGLITDTFTEYCMDLFVAGWINGWYFPLLYQDHMDDPRSPNSAIQSDADIERHLPLSARANGVTTVEEWTKQQERSALLVQRASTSPTHWTRRRRLLRRVRARIKKAVTGSSRQW